MEDYGSAHGERRKWAGGRMYIAAGASVPPLFEGRSMAKRMTRKAAAATLAAACLTPLILAGCSSSQTRTARADADRNAPVAAASSNVQRYRIRDWTAIDDHTLIIVTQDGTRYRAETLGPCNGLGFAT